MKTAKYTVIKAKFSGTQLYGGTGYSKIGDILIMFPCSSFQGFNKNGKKTFKSEYVKLNDLYKFPEFSEIREEIKNKYHINPDTYGQLKVTWRK